MTEQLDFPFPIDAAKLEEFLACWIACEDAEDRLRQEKADLRQAFTEALPLRAVLTAIKVMRAQRTLADHPREALARHDQPQVEALVDAFLDRQWHRILTLIGADMHEASPRPCVTCDEVSTAYGQPWGCQASRKRMEARQRREG